MTPRLKDPDCVTTEYIEAARLGVLVRTPLENVAFFKAEHKAVVAHTKGNGEFTLQVPMHEIEDTLKGQATLVHRSYLVMNQTLSSVKNWHAGSGWVMEIITHLRMGDRQALVPHLIPISRRLTKKVKKVIDDHTHRTPQ